MSLTLPMSTNLYKCRVRWQHSLCPSTSKTTHYISPPSRLPPKSMYPSHSPTLYLCCLHTNHFFKFPTLTLHLMHISQPRWTIYLLLPPNFSPYLFWRQQYQFFKRFKLKTLKKIIPKPSMLSHFVSLIPHS